MRGQNKTEDNVELGFYTNRARAELWWNTGGESVGRVKV